MSNSPLDIKPKPIPAFLNFLLAGVSGAMAASIMHPLDVIKIGMQTAGMRGTPGTFRYVLKDVIASQGVPGFYKGIDAAILRQLTYTTMRMGVYNWLLPKFNDADGSQANFAKKAALGMFGGMCGACVGTPAAVCLVRLAADGRLPPAQRRNYTHVVNAMYRIVKEEGVLTLWRGLVPTIGRAAVVNGSQMATYSQVKEIYINRGMRDGFLLQFYASMTSGIVTAINSLPVDIIKTRIQNMKVVDGKPQYSGVVDAAVKVVSKEGVFTLWKGFLPYYARLGPVTVLSLIFLENLTFAARRLYNP